jgi:hypothetical protein
MKSPKKLIIATSVLVILLLVIYFSFLNNSNQAQQQLEGMWLRSDGTYKIEIKKVQDEGKLVAAYFNPNPINIGRSGWRIQNEELQIYVELQDENYQGSMYQLTFDDQTGKLVGTYYQAVSGQTYEVNFTQTKN